MSVLSMIVVVWLVTGAVVGAVVWQLDDEHTWWAREVNDLAVAFQVDPARATVIGLVFGVITLTVLSLVVIGWPGVLAGRAMARRARRR